MVDVELMYFSDDNSRMAVFDEAEGPEGVWLLHKYTHTNEDGVRQYTQIDVCFTDGDASLFLESPEDDA